MSVLIIADQKADPELVAIDMFAQAEHDELAQAILMTSSMKLINSVNLKISGLIKTQSRREIIEKSLNKRGLFIKVNNIKEIISIIKVFFIRLVIYFLPTLVLTNRFKGYISQPNEEGTPD